MAKKKPVMPEQNVKPIEHPLQKGWQRVKIPDNIRDKIEGSERQFIFELVGKEVPSRWDWRLGFVDLKYTAVDIRMPRVQKTLKGFEREPLYGHSKWKFRLRELLDKDEAGDLTEAEDKELTKLMRRNTRKQMERIS